MMNLLIRGILAELGTSVGVACTVITYISNFHRRKDLGKKKKASPCPIG